MHETIRCSTRGDWTSTSLGMVTSCTLGGTPSTNVPQFWGGEIPWMASGDVHLRRVHDVPGRITSTGLAASNATLVLPPAVAVGLAGQGKTRGTVALTLCELSSNQSIALLRGDGAQLQTEYLFHNLDRRYEELRARSSGGGRGGLSKGILDAVPIELPPLPEQRLITEVLDTLDTTIRQTEAIIEKLKQVKQGLLHDLLTRGIDVNGELRAPQSQAPHLYKRSIFKDTLLEWIPRGWRELRLREVLIGIDGGWSPDCIEERPREGQWGVLKVSAVSSGTYRSSESKTLPSSLRPDLSLEVAVGDVLLARANGVAELVAVTVYVDATPPRLMLSDKTLRLKPLVGQLTGRFLATLMASHSTRSQIGGMLSGSSGQRNISQRQIGDLVVVVPQILEQGLANQRLNALSDLITHEEAAMKKLRRQKVGLMDDLLTGRVRVTSLLDLASCLA